ncbi:MAG: PAS modulated sigma54 specific transcriptional regulator, Fis family [Thermoanaerobacterales bacterium 50_218]|nr:MAG: PAS modulated sigma54 specific transcriptional regulator, Fis family [Thermoanaerobacterales bacterium 50_218]HAA90171.1 AAA family ATPase [Peptococcaceae bacterium]
MRVRDVMTKNNVYASIHDTLDKVAKIFHDHQVDCVPVLDDEGKLQGVIDKNHFIKAITTCRHLSTPISDVMARNMPAVTPDDDLTQVSKIKFESECIPVLEKGKVVGILKRTDLINAISKNKNGQYTRALLDSLLNPIIAIDTEEIVRACNMAAARLFGKEPCEIIGMPLKSILKESGLPNVLSAGRPEPGQKITIGNRTFVSNRTPIYVDGKIVGAVAVLQDISELEAISKELSYTKELSRELDAIIESSFDGIFVTDGSGKVLKVNQAYERITGIKKEEVLGRTMQELVEQGFYDRSVTLEVLKTGKAQTIVQEVKTGKTILVTGNPIYDTNGNIFRVVTNVRDITELNRLQQEVKRMQELQQHYEEVINKLRLQVAHGETVVVKSKKMNEVMELAARLAQVDSTVLIYGESGVGKELIANFIHENSPRKKAPFIKINCAAIPENLLESELFGYEEGAFTGARKGGKIGVFEIANKGTLFLDEIGELPLSLQAKLLRVLQEKEITKVGGVKPIKIDVRIIAATNRNLHEMVEQNQFRRDLFYRLNVLSIYVPPLRERREDIPPLAFHFLEKVNKEYGFNKRLDPQVIKLLVQYDWPGNVRELSNAIERLVVMSSGEVITYEDAKTYLFNWKANNGRELEHYRWQPLKKAVEEFEKSLLTQAFETFKTTYKVAEVLGVNQSTIVRKAMRYGIPIGKQTSRKTK